MLVLIEFSSCVAAPQDVLRRLVSRPANASSRHVLGQPEGGEDGIPPSPFHPSPCHTFRSRRALQRRSSPLDHLLTWIVARLPRYMTLADALVIAATSSLNTPGICGNAGPFGRRITHLQSLKARRSGCPRGRAFLLPFRAARTAPVAVVKSLEAHANHRTLTPSMRSSNQPRQRFSPQSRTMMASAAHWMGPRNGFSTS